MRRPGIFAGTVLLVIGLLFLAANFGVLAPLTWRLLWPLLLVALGVWVIATAFLPRGTYGGAGESFAIPLDGASAGRVIVRHGAGRLTVGARAAAGALVDGTAVGGVEHRETRSAEGVTAELSPPRDWVRWPDVGGSLDWQVRLTGAVPLAVELHVGASENRVDLTPLRVTEVVLETGASSTEIRLPAHGVVKVRVRSGAASVRLLVPANAAARVAAKGGMANIQVSGRFPRAGSVWESPDFATSADRVEIDAELGVGELRVD